MIASAGPDEGSLRGAARVPTDQGLAGAKDGSDLAVPRMGAGNREAATAEGVKGAGNGVGASGRSKNGPRNRFPR